MLLRIGLEKSCDGDTIAWALDHPGCTATGSDEEDAVDNMERAVLEYADWLARHDPNPWLRPEYVESEVIDIQVEENFECYHINGEYELVDEGYEVNAWFLNDWRPLTGRSIDRGLKVLTWSRDDLLKTVEGLSPEIMERRYTNERWSVLGILKHIAGAEYWYMERLDLAFPPEDLPKDAFERLRVVRAALFDLLPTLEGSERVIGKDGQFWSPRKLLRRAAWHELDHIRHIRRLLKD